MALIATLPVTFTATPELPTATTQPTVEQPTVAPTEGTSPPSSAIVQPTPTATAYTLQGYQDELKKYFADMKTAQVSEKFLRAAIKDQLLRDKLSAVITADQKPEEEQVWARHILVAKEEEAWSVLDRLKKGENFAAIAAEVSIDTSNKDQGGDLGWFGKGKMVKEFEDAAFALKVGEISAQPVKTQFGYHIIQVIGHEVRPIPLSDFETARQTFFDTWLETTKGEYKIVKNDNWQTDIPVIPTLPATSTAQ
jgi:peptidyl-prolyl cis-trans isomerase D